MVFIFDPARKRMIKNGFLFTGDIIVRFPVCPRISAGIPSALKTGFFRHAGERRHPELFEFTGPRCLSRARSGIRRGTRVEFFKGLISFGQRVIPFTQNFLYR
jgi:hypothetical protein